MNFSIIICTYNRVDLLRDALLSIERMSLPDGYNVEVIVVDNASTDNTSEVINNFKEDKKIFLRGLFEPRLGKTYALNMAIKNAIGEVLSFVDDDHIVSSGYMDAVNKVLKGNPSYNLFCGRILPAWDGSEPRWVHDDKRYPIRPFPIPNFDLGKDSFEIKPGNGFIPGAGNLIIRKPVFEKAGFFSERLGPKGRNLSGGEDIEFVTRAMRKGEMLLYVPEILQYHQVDLSRLALSYLLKKAFLRSVTAYQFSGLNQSRRIRFIPSYLFRQAINRFMRALLTINNDARRYYLVRLAATLGEIQGYRNQKRQYVKNGSY